MVSWEGCFTLNGKEASLRKMVFEFRFEKHEGASCMNVRSKNVLGTGSKLMKKLEMEGI